MLLLFYHILPLISIHALREEGVGHNGSKVIPDLYFSPRPRGGRPGNWRTLVPVFYYFYPRPPRGGRPLCCTGAGCKTLISIHALREEGDVGFEVCSQSLHISIHALREEGDHCRGWLCGER